MTDIPVIGSMFVQWLQAHREAHGLYIEWRNGMQEDPNDPIESKKHLAEMVTLANEAGAKATEAADLYSKLIEATDLHLAAQVTEIKND